MLLVVSSMKSTNRTCNKIANSSVLTIAWHQTSTECISWPEKWFIYRHRQLLCRDGTKCNYLCSSRYEPCRAHKDEIQLFLQSLAKPLCQHFSIMHTVPEYGWCSHENVYFLSYMFFYDKSPLIIGIYSHAEALDCRQW